MLPASLRPKSHTTTEQCLSVILLTAGAKWNVMENIISSFKQLRFWCVSRCAPKISYNYANHFLIKSEKWNAPEKNVSHFKCYIQKMVYYYEIQMRFCIKKSYWFVKVLGCFRWTLSVCEYNCVQFTISKWSQSYQKRIESKLILFGAYICIVCFCLAPPFNNIVLSLRSACTELF